ncbi:MAG: fluoride efflux transporter CrcB [Methylobacterium sp.]|uniref:fluoride efflux transporter CrcB n=1 Tax=Methylobacterium sp. TaxID=409 RepID=UPI00258DAB57|nr:fluoride efflux transporter CrcB [Methylobacterium sp.]MBY0299948.1 fluoride efflux transporter CrcB [Methylobacterium sp.]
MLNTLVVFLGAGLGGALRHGVNVAAARLGGDFPAGTMLINIAGSVLMGVLTGWFAVRGGVAQPWRLFLTTGVLGGFTTFSTFSLDAFLLVERGALWGALVYVLGSVAAGIAGVAVSLAVIRTLG